MASFRFKILALAVLLVLLAQLGTVGAMLFSSSREVTARGDAMLAKARDLTEQLSVVRTARLRSAGSVLAGDHQFREAVDRRLDGRAGSGDTLAVLLRDYGRQAEVDLGLVLDPEGRALASTVPIEPERLRLPGLISHAQTYGPVRFALSTYGNLYEVVTVPVGAPEAVAWLVLGFRLDGDLAIRLAATTGLDVTLLARAEPDPRIIGSSLPGDEAIRIARDALSASRDPGRPQRVGRDVSQHVALLTAFIPGAGDVEILLSEQLDSVMAPYRALRLSVLGSSALVLALALVGGLHLSRAVTRPLQELARAARRIGDGDYRQSVDVQGHGEVAELTRALNTMQLGIAEREEHISNQIRYDSLTGLPTRLHAMEYLEDAIRRAGPRRRPITVLVVDLQEFSRVGASLGSDIGDALICQAAERLRSALDPRHLLARLEGDQFLGVLPDTGPEPALDIAEDLRRFLASGLSVRDVNVAVDACCGLAVYPFHGVEPDQLLQRAAVARNEACRDGTGCRVYAEGNEERQHRQLTLLADLRRAARHDEFRVYMQPKVRLRDGRICGAEALVRWQHPTYGFLTPDQFIPIAEQSGNISLITRWALTASVRECRLWVEEGLHLPVSVNLSAQDLKDEDLPCFVMSLLRDHDLEPGYLMMEITEEAVMEDFARATLVLQCLRDLGVRIAIDDFGTGHSSLAKIRHLPVDELKVDRSFVRDLPEDRQNGAIVRAVVELAHSLGLEVLAEGVETRSAMAWLQAVGCETAQGYLISRPMPAEQFADWVVQEEAAPTPPADRPADQLLSVS
jgi:diguanylate cyclase (GGDEF)-like protein